MTREEFMKHAREEIDRAFAGHRNRMMNLVEQAWAEGKRNAEADSVLAVVRSALSRMEKPQTVSTGLDECNGFHRVCYPDGRYKDFCWAAGPEWVPCRCGGDQKKCELAMEDDRK